jgi:hypothetical protein
MKSGGAEWSGTPANLTGKFAAGALLYSDTRVYLVELGKRAGTDRGDRSGRQAGSSQTLTLANPGVGSNQHRIKVESDRPVQLAL